MAILDTRTEPTFLGGHAPGAANIPLEELARRTHELPPKGGLVTVFDADGDRLRRATEWLERRGYVVKPAILGLADLCATGAARAWLWRPSSFLIEALARIESLGVRDGRALDLACGSGREAVWLALRGWQVDAIDVLPDALERASDLARRCGATLNTIRQDLKGDPRLPSAAYDLVCLFRFMHRPLLPAIAPAVRNGGFVVCETFHVSDAPDGTVLPTNRDDQGAERLDKPCGVRRGHLVRDGELPAAFRGFEVLIARDGVDRDGRRFCQLLARRKRV